MDPYMNVTVIGEETYGKCYGSITIPDFEDPPRHNWAMQPIVLKYANAEGYTDFDSGLTPDIAGNDDLFNAVPFGDQNDPLLAEALEDITGVAVSTKKSLKETREIHRLHDPVREFKSTALLSPSSIPILVE